MSIGLGMKSLGVAAGCDPHQRFMRGLSCPVSVAHGRHRILVIWNAANDRQADAAWPPSVGPETSARNAHTVLSDGGSASKDDRAAARGASNTASISRAQ